jgi:hypothetical protein
MAVSLFFLSFVLYIVFNENIFLDVQPFVLYWDRDKPWLDVPHLLLDWLSLARAKRGPIFVRFDAHDRPIHGKAMVCSIKTKMY